MNKLKILAGIVLVMLISLTFIDWKQKEVKKEPIVTKRSGTAILLTGAAARIPQEAALLEELYNKGLLKDLVFISGVSSGALNAVMLNGILSGRMSWEEYREILFNLKNSDIFVQEGKKKLPVNTNPARQLFTKIVENKLGYHQIGDLPFMTEISFTNLKALDLKKKVYRMCSRKINEETDTTLSLVDIMMASSSFPLVFPSVRIKNAVTIPNVDYIDGGVGEDYVPYHALLEFEKFRGMGVAKVYIISRKSDSIPEVSQEFARLGIDDKGRFDRLGISLDNILRKEMIRKLRNYSDEAPGLAQVSYVWIPDFDQNFLMFNFENLKEQYLLTTNWAKAHDPMPLDDFLLNNQLRRKKNQRE